MIIEKLINLEIVKIKERVVNATGVDCLPVYKYIIKTTEGRPLLPISCLFSCFFCLSYSHIMLALVSMWCFLFVFVFLSYIIKKYHVVRVSISDFTSLFWCRFWLCVGNWKRVDSITLCCHLTGFCITWVIVNCNKLITLGCIDCCKRNIYFVFIFILFYFFHLFVVLWFFFFFFLLVHYFYVT